MPQKPRRLDSNAIFFPSGDRSGRILSPFSETKTDGAGGVCLASWGGGRNILNWGTPCPTTIVLLWGGIEAPPVPPKGPASGRGIPPCTETRHKPTVAPRS